MKSWRLYRRGALKGRPEINERFKAAAKLNGREPEFPRPAGFRSADEIYGETRVFAGEHTMANVYVLRAPIDAPRINSTMVNSFHARTRRVCCPRQRQRSPIAPQSLFSVKLGLLLVGETSRHSHGISTGLEMKRAERKRFTLIPCALDLRVTCERGTRMDSLE